MEFHFGLDIKKEVYVLNTNVAIKEETSNTHAFRIVSTDKDRAGEDFIGSSLDMYFKEMPKDAILTGDEECELVTRYKNGDLAARDEMIKRNQKLVVKYAKSFVGHGLELEDLIQEGNLGLIKAIDKFDPTMGYKFSTYGTWWIKQTILRAIHDQGRTIRIPVHVGEKQFLINKAKKKYIEEHGTEPSLTELSTICNMSEEDISRIQADCMALASLDKDMTDKSDDPATLMEIIADDTKKSVEDLVAESVLSDKIDQYLSEILSEREKDVIKYRFGFEAKPMTLEDVGKIFGVTRERIRQIESNAIRKLRNNRRVKELSYFITD